MDICHIHGYARSADVMQHIRDLSYPRCEQSGCFVCHQRHTGAPIEGMGRADENGKFEWVVTLAGFTQNLTGCYRSTFGESEYPVKRPL